MSPALEEVNRSFGQCCVSAGFFDEFYKHFLQQSPEIRQMFKGTDMSRQKSLLRNGISHLILTYKGALMSQKKIEKLAHTHNRTNLNIKPSFYPMWQRSLYKAIRSHDPDFSDKTKKAWEEVLMNGITQMRKAY